MKKLNMTALVMVFCLCSLTASAEEWSTPEALRAFGKPGDTVRDRSTTETAPKKERRSKKIKTEKTISVGDTGRPYKSDSLEKLYERDKNCDKYLIEMEEMRFEDEKEILTTEHEIEKAKIRLDDINNQIVPANKARAKQALIENYESSIAFHKKALALSKGKIADVESHIKSMEKMRADNMKEIELRKKQ
ncbi:hypothetical protein HXX01_05195 [Candidatus Nomurabacteria bacterium]|nr:hypothetical protein [Candidatus Nomurabacteria bacterium]